MRRLLGGLLLAFLVLHPLARLGAHVRLRHPATGAGLHWSRPESVEVVLNARGSDDLGPGGHLAPLRLALEEWSRVPGSRARLIEDASPIRQARTDHEAKDLHLVIFDEDNASGFFPAGSPVVALTPVWFFANGTIQDADVLFNGASFRFANGIAPGRVDVQNVAAHELGHLLGLDHTGVAGATMYPYVDQGVLLQRSLSADELSALRDVYPDEAAGEVRGRVERAEDGRGVAGAYVAARDADGRLASSILADEEGEFRLRGLRPGSYTLYARPLDAPVGEEDLAYAGRIETDFEAALLATPVVLAPGASGVAGPIVVQGDVALALGSRADDFPLRGVIGETRTVRVHGSLLFVGSSLAASDPDLVLGDPLWQGAYVTFSLTVPMGELPGHVDLTVTSATGRTAILPGALEITPPEPLILVLEPDSGSSAGGETVLVRGAHFGSGLRVVIGEHIYADGLDALRLDEQTIRIRTAAMPPGIHDVVVVDPSGVEGRARAAFRTRSAPELTSLLPRAGDARGGTEVWLAGQGFVEGMRVRIDGVDQGPVSLAEPGLARFTTRGGAVGGPYALELENPDGGRVEQTFVYVDQPDPRLTRLEPATGSAEGGSWLTLVGEHFTPTMSVAFLADPAAEARGASQVLFVDAHSLRVRTPAHPAGQASILITETNEAGTLLEGSFSFTPGASGGGGACATISAPGPGGPRQWLDGAGWMLLVLVWLAGLARRERAEPLVATSRSRVRS